MSQDVVLDRVSMRFGDFVAVRDVSLRIEPGEFFAFLGPSGCGKTTILRLISGFTDASEGAVRIGGKDMRGIGPNKRPTALIFQNLALFPLMPVWENIAFGLEVRGQDKAARRKRAQELLELVALPDAGDKQIAELSGGQKQRVAIARALAVEPQVMLLDEPLSALDLKLRQHMRAELRSIQRRTGVTFIYITHDQGEALTMADRVAVMSRGLIQQVGRPSEVYDDPATSFVASFVGETNLFRGQVVAQSQGMAQIETPAGLLLGRALQPLAIGSPAMLFVRPERMRLGNGVDNTLRGQLAHVDFEGAFTNLFLEGPGGQRLIVQQGNHGSEAAPAQGSAITVGFTARDGIVLPPGELAPDLAAVGQLLHRYGGPLTALLVLLPAFWVLVLVVLPYLFMVDYSFRPNLLPEEMGGPKDVHTLSNYVTLFTNTLHFRIFLQTIWASAFVTALSLVVCYPIAWYLAQVAPKVRVPLLLLLLIIPFWINEILRTFAWFIILAYQGPLNALLRFIGVIDQPIRWLSGSGGVVVGMVYAFILFMMFPLYNALDTLDPNQVEAARDLGAGTIRIHRRIVIPHAKPGIAVGCIMVFVLVASSYAVPLILGSPSSFWFTQIIYQWFFEGQNWPQGSAYAFLLLLLCLVFIQAMMRIFKVGLADIAK